MKMRPSKCTLDIAIPLSERPGVLASTIPWSCFFLAFVGELHTLEDETQMMGVKERSFSEEGEEGHAGSMPSMIRVSGDIHTGRNGFFRNERTLRKGDVKTAC